MASILADCKYTYCEFNPKTGKPCTPGTEQVYTEGEIHLNVPAKIAPARKVREVREVNPVRRPVYAAEEFVEDISGDEVSDDEEHEPLPRVEVPVVRAEVPVVRVIENAIKCENEDQFWDIIRQVGWKSPAEGVPDDVSIINRLDAPGRVIFRRLYDQFINTLRLTTDRITPNANEAIKIASHFIGLGRDTYYGVVEDSTFIILLHEEGMIGNFDAVVLRELA